MIKMRSRKGTVLFAFFPGAGHMFNGFMKLGISFMFLFWAVIALASWLRLGYLALFVPAIWFWSFMDAINRRYQDEADFYAQEDRWLFDTVGVQSRFLEGKGRLIAGVVLILIGLYALIENFVVRVLPDWIWEDFGRIIHNAPQLILSLAIIIIGIALIRGRRKKMLLEQSKDGDWQDEDFNDAV